jgi:putative N6-adenine-specific DNA methylase
LRAEARAGERPAPPLFGSDADAQALAQCSANAERARLAVSLRQLPLARVDAGLKPGALIANPPYGERLARPEHLTRDLDALLERFGGSQRALIVPRGFPSRLRASRLQPVFNGPIECELRRYDAVGPRLSFRR